MAEEWRSIDGWPYEVSSEGRIRRSLLPKKPCSTHVGKILKGVIDSGGYRNVSLHNGTKGYRVRVQYLVASAFLEPKPSPSHMLDHINRIRDDNRASNLRWVIARQNAENSSRVINRVPKQRGRSSVLLSLRAPKVRLSPDQVIAIRQRYSGGVETYDSLAAAFGVAKSTIGFIVRGETWRSL